MVVTEISSRVKLTSILIVTACLVCTISKKVKVKHGPSGMSVNDITNCSEFSKFARFNPLSVLRERWFVFYYWGAARSLLTFVFTFPTANHTRHLKKLFDGKVVLPVMWSARQILMEDNHNYISLLVERSDRGEYWMYPVAKVQGTHKITPRDIRLKQTGDNRLLGLMDCFDQSLLVMSRLNDVPRKDKLLEEATRLGFRGRRGRSYLYQGHEWGPMPEADEELYWDYGKRRSKDTSTEDKSTEGSSEEAETHPTNEPEPSQEKKRKARESIAVSKVPDLDQEMCVKVEPELWNDPKPYQSPNTNSNNLMTKEELNNLDNILDINNTLTIEATDESPNNKQENKLDKESDITEKIDKLDNHKDVSINEMEVALNEPKNFELQTGNPDLEENENCVVCFHSQVSYFSTGEPDRSDSTGSITNLENNEEAPRVKLQRTKVPHPKEPDAEVPLPKVPHPEEPLAEIPHPEQPLAELPHAEVPRAEIPRAKIPRGKIPRGKVPRAKVPNGSKAPQLDLTNSSEVIILSPKTLHDLKS